MFDKEEERFFASESLTGVLTPSLLENRDKEIDFCLKLQDNYYKLDSYAEDEREIHLSFICKTPKLFPLLTASWADAQLSMANSEINIDLSKFDASRSIFKIDKGTYKVDLRFQKSPVEVLND